jgi:hypothetical protein
MKTTNSITPEIRNLSIKSDIISDININASYNGNTLLVLSKIREILLKRLAKIEI